MEDNSSKEINLLQLLNLLFAWIVKCIKGIVLFFGHLIQLTYKFRLITFLLVICGTGVGLYLSRPSAKIYKAEAMAMLYGSEAQTVKEVCKQLENSIASNNLYSLPAKLSLPDSITKNIVEFHAFYAITYRKDSVAEIIDFKDSHPISDTINVKMKDRLYFQILTTNIAQLPKVQDAILNYLNNNAVLKNEYINKKNELSQRIKICNDEIKRIDSLAKISYFKTPEKQLKFENNNLLIGEQKKQLFYDDLLRLQKMKSKTESKLMNFKQPVVLPAGFAPSPQALNGTLKYSAIGLLIGYLVAVLTSFLLESRKAIVRYLEGK
jgi:hypothetical protein